jgi:hypothetical protein
MNKDITMEENNNNSEPLSENLDRNTNNQTPEKQESDVSVLVRSSKRETDNSDDWIPKKEDTRSKLALLFVLGFFSIIFLCFAYAIKVGASLNSLKDMLVGVIGALSGIFGFIVGYYYKSSEQ